MKQNLHLGFSPWYLSAPFGIACFIAVCAVVLQNQADVELEPFTVSIRPLQRTDFFRLIAGVQNSGTEKAYDTQIDAVFWRCSGTFAPFAVRKTKGNPISPKVREQVELDFSMHPLEPAFVVLAFAYRPRPDAKLRYQLPHFYYVWNGEQGELDHASAEERDKIVGRIGKKEIPSGLIHDIKTAPGHKPAVENELVSPKISLSAGPNVTESYSINRWGMMQVRFLHPVVSIDSGTIKSCTGYLQRVKKNEREWTVGDQLTFSSSSKPRGELTKTLHHGAIAKLDVLVITSGQEIRVCNEERDWRRFPSLQDMFAETGIYLLEVAIVGEGVALQTFTLRFEWTGDWQTSFLHSDATTQTINRLPNPSGSLKPIEIRDLLDVFIRIGEELLREWCSKKDSLAVLQAQTQQWLQAVNKFVREYFDIKHVDKLNDYGNTVNSTDRRKFSFNLANAAVDPHTQPEAYELGFKTYVLKYFRKEHS